MQKPHTILFIWIFFQISLYGGIKNFELFLSKKVQEKSPPSVSFSILHADKIRYIKSIGYNDKNRSRATTHKSVYHVYSLTKILTLSLIMKLIERGEMGLHDSLKKYFPYLDLRYKNKKVDVKILHLLNHSSGITDSSKEIQYMLGKNPHHTYQKLHHLPGSKAKYSNTEYILLGKLAQKVTGKKFETLIKRYILAPAKMKNSAFYYTKKIANDQVYGTIPFFSIIGTVMRFMLDERYHDTYDGTILWLKSFTTGWKPAGGLISSIEDMSKFLLAYQENRLFGKKMKQYITQTKSIPVDSWLLTQDKVHFGLGWYHIEHKGEFFYQHQGVGPGFRAIMRIYPKYDLSFIILTSQTSIDIDNWADRLAEEIIVNGKLHL